MKHSRYVQFAIVHEDTVKAFNDALNAEIFELRENDPVVEILDTKNYFATVKYVVNETAPETLAEHYEMIGAGFTCVQCPCFKPTLKEDGTEDKRCKYGDCEHAEMKRTIKNAPACEKLYELINERRVKLCFTDSDC